MPAEIEENRQNVCIPTLRKWFGETWMPPKTMSSLK